jgi:arylsulfatase A-like enzyme
MNRRHFLQRSAVLTTAGVAQAAGLQGLRAPAMAADPTEGASGMSDAADRPNVVFILTDDQGPWAAGCCGNPEIRTPNLDRLAAEGTRLSKFFVATPVCSPSRGTLLTGRICSQHGIHEWINRQNVGPEAVRFLADEVAYTDVMAEHGYRCGISGKWHMGDSQHPQHSFDFWFVHQRGGGQYNNAPMVRDGELVDEPGYVTDVITDEALKYIDASKDERFYLSVHYTAPHSPWTGHPQDIVDSYDDCAFESCPQEPKHPWAGRLTDNCLGNREMLKGYFAAVTAMDGNVGRILDRLDELNLADDTLVVFVSDNGFSCGHHGFWGKGNGTHPRNMYENSVLVPFIARHPERIPAGRVDDTMVSAYDFLPTLLDYADLPLPEGRNLPGRSFAPVLDGSGEAGNDFVVVYDEYGPVRMIRTEAWKYVHRYPDGPHDLYDLRNDPDERRNLADDATHASRARELRAEMEEWFARYVEPEHDGLKETY